MRLPQAPTCQEAFGPAWRAVRLAACLCVAPLLAGCGASALNLAEAKVDRSIITSNIQTRAVSSDPEQWSDEATIRNAVSAADIGSLDGDALAWANADTGSRGAISAVKEENEQGLVCRKFTTTRESFDGVALFNGKACMVAPGAWQMTAFAPI